MSSPKAQKIDFNADYPCPCGRRGRLVPITLTEAFGCNKCQQIFVVEENGHAIEQLLSTTYPYKKAWLWTGSRWLRAHSGFKHYYLPLMIFFILISLGVVILLTQGLFAGSNHIHLLLVALVITIVPALIFWLAYRH